MVHSHHGHTHQHHHHERPAADLNDLDRRVDVGLGFRCTFCKQPIGVPVRAKDLGMKPGEEAVPDKLYPYSRCYCGRGRFVLSEHSYIEPEEVEAHLVEHMMH